VIHIKDGRTATVILPGLDRFRNRILTAPAIAIPAWAGEAPVIRLAVDDRKAIIATVEPMHELGVVGGPRCDWQVPQDK
jgi:hypothetical protein